MTTSYADFLNSKRITVAPSGFNVEPSNPYLFPFQRDLVRWSLRIGKAAIWADCGLGKSLMELSWTEHVVKQFNAPVLILAPLSVSHQTAREGEKFGIPCRVVASQAEVDGPGIYITNYEKLHHFDPSVFPGIVLDESGCLKNFTSVMRNLLIEKFVNTPMKLCCSATPAPNDRMELGNHSEFLGVLTRAEMLSTFFVHDGGDTSKWRLKGHAQEEYWRWMCQWAVMMRRPSDLGYEDNGFVLPPLNYHHHVVRSEKNLDGFLFPVEAQTLLQRRGARRDSLRERVDLCANLVNASDRSWVIWCGLNVEGDLLEQSIPSAVQIAGADSDDFKMEAFEWFVGAKCICANPRFRAKLTTWRQVNAGRDTGSGITQPIENSGSQKQLNTNDNTRTNGASTCENITRQTRLKNGPSELQSNEPLLTLSGERNTIRTLSSENTTKRQSKNGRQVTPTSEKPSVLSDTELRLNNSTQLSKHKAEAAPSADTATCPSQDFSHSSITAMTPESCEGFYVQPVILALENSATIPRFSSEQPCICGHTSGVRRLISKGSIAGWGLNFQFCSDTAFVGLSDSYEELYQCTRRLWRFGQTREVNCHVITSEAEGAVVRNIQRKEADAARMAKEMVKHMSVYNTEAVHKGTVRTADVYQTRVERGEQWEMRLGDCVELVKDVASDSVHYSIFSPPFASLYTYSASERDMGNARTHAEFYYHFQYLIDELYRVLMPGRLLSFHCMNLPTSKERDGVIGISDFRGDLIRMFCGSEAAILHEAKRILQRLGRDTSEVDAALVDASLRSGGFIYHSEVVIWKDPVTAMQRTKALGLLHKQLVKDSCMSRQGIPDYLVTMRKPGDNPERVVGPLPYYAGNDATVSDIQRSPYDTWTGEESDKSRRSINIWQRYASPVWDDINPSDTLQRESAREDADERHICPLQLQVIERGLQLWTNPGDLVYSPFAGIGSEGYRAVQMGRRFLGHELKESYFKQAVANLRNAETAMEQTTLFSGVV